MIELIEIYDPTGRRKPEDFTFFIGDTAVDVPIRVYHCDHRDIDDSE